jgi:hypothetical protein
MPDRDASEQRPNLGDPIRELVILSDRFADSYSELLVKIDDEGRLVLYGADAGERVREIWGDWDYEYSETVPAEWKETVLLHLIKERFAATSDFRVWCEERGIPSEFWSWA